MQATEELSRLVTESASQRPATLKDFRAQELAIEMQTRLWELSEFQPIGSLQEEITRKYCHFPIRDKGARLNSAMQNAIGNALTQLLDTTHGDRDNASKLTIKEVFAICREKFCSINGAPICRSVDENLRKERAILAQAETKTKVAKIKKELTLAKRNCKAQVSTTSSQGEYGKGTCGARFQEQEGKFSGR